MEVVLYHSERCHYGHDNLESSRELYSILHSRGFNMIPRKLPISRVVSCHLKTINSLSKPHEKTLYQKHLLANTDYLIIIFDSSLQDPITIELCDENMNNGEFFNNYLSQQECGRLPTVKYQNFSNWIAKKLTKNDEDEKPYCILRINGFDNDSVVKTVTLYKEYLS